MMLDKLVPRLNPAHGKVLRPCPVSYRRSVKEGEWGWVECGALGALRRRGGP